MMKKQITFAVVTVAIAAVVAGLSTIGLNEGIQVAFAQGPPSPFPGQGDPQGPPSDFPGQGQGNGPSDFPGQGQGNGPPWLR
jgi:hypothetical protein